MTQPNPYRLLVFDWDGTLVDSIGRIVRCFRMSFAQLGLPEPEDEAISQLIGLPLVDSFKRLNPNLSETQEAALENTYREIWLGGLLPESALFPGVPAMLTDLKQRGYHLAVATGKSRVGLDRELAHHKMGHHFEHSRCAGEGPAKPHPEILLALINLYDVTPQQTLMIGDTTMDLEMANNAGAIPVGVTTGGHSMAHLKATQPLACLNAVTDLPELLGH